MTTTDFSECIHLSRITVSKIINGRASITPDIAIRLEKGLGQSREMWIGMQSAYDLWRVDKEPRPAIKRVARPVVEAEETVYA